MKRKLKYILTILWFTYLIVSSILLFTKGFLLTREVQDRNSSCVALDSVYCDTSHSLNSCIIINNKPLNTFNEAHNLCWKTNFKVILLIVDALRYDFAAFKETNEKLLPYENKLPVIKDVLDKFPDSSRLYKFIADPPTTTMQRLKALTTGSLPTFIDAGSNFATSEINEDNIIDQVVKNDGKIVFMGDDTWTSLYPNRFIRNYPYPSFEVWDLDTVDNGVRTRLFSELNNSDWNVLIGHFLGVDHCGHRYGPNHSEMSRKLTEINNVIKEVVDVMDDTSVLFVIGDHGMTGTGDHGGESIDELQAAMFVYSKHLLSSLDRDKKSVKQVDLIPTLSAILGIPIPFQNLGILIHSALPALGTSSTNFWHLPLFWLWGNVQQVINYIRTYSESTEIFDLEYLNLYYKEYDMLYDELGSVDNEEKFLAFSKKCTDFLIKIRSLCEEVWIQFDAFSISNGLTFLFLSVFFMFIISDGIPLNSLPLAIEGSFIVICIIGLIFSVILLMIVSFSLADLSFTYNSIFIINVLSHLMFLLPVFQNWDVISMNWYTKSKAYGIINLICRFVLIFSVAGVFSNSFVNEEATVLLFLLVSVFILAFFGLASFLKNDQNSKRKGEPSETISTSTFLKLLIATFIVLSLLRASIYFWRCRVEQEWCFVSPHTTNTNSLKSQASKLQWGLCVISLCGLVMLMKTWLRKCGNLNGYSLTETFIRIIPSVIIVCIAGFWVLQRLAGNTRSISRTSNYLALSVYGLTAICIVETLICPLCINVILKGKDTSALDDYNIISTLFNKLKKNWKKESDNDDGVPIVCGLGTAYSAVYLILGIYLILLIALLLGDSFAFSVVIMVAVGAVFLVITSMLRIKKAETLGALLEEDLSYARSCKSVEVEEHTTNADGPIFSSPCNKESPNIAPKFSVVKEDDLLNIPDITVIGWMLISEYFFYASGHQPAFSNIAWESAFVGTSGLFTNNYMLGTLVILNTFGSHILLGILSPLLVITPFTLLIMIPSLCGKHKEFFVHAEKGEMILFERERMTIPALFALSCKYILGHTVKVFACMLAATIHCRHLMVWNVFAPKFIFEGVGLFLTLGSVLIGYSIFLRINSQIERLVNKLNKMQ